MIIASEERERKISHTFNIEKNCFSLYTLMMRKLCVYMCFLHRCGCIDCVSPSLTFTAFRNTLACLLLLIPGLFVFLSSSSSSFLAKNIEKNGNWKIIFLRSLSFGFICIYVG